MVDAYWGCSCEVCHISLSREYSKNFETITGWDRQKYLIITLLPTSQRGNVGYWLHLHYLSWFQKECLWRWLNK